MLYCFFLCSKFDNEYDIFDVIIYIKDVNKLIFVLILNLILKGKIRNIINCEFK